MKYRLKVLSIVYGHKLGCCFGVWEEKILMKIIFFYDQCCASCLACGSQWLKLILIILNTPSSQFLFLILSAEPNPSFMNMIRCMALVWVLWLVVKPKSKSPIPGPNRPQIMTLSSDQAFKNPKANYLDWGWHNNHMGHHPPHPTPNF